MAVVPTVSLVDALRQYRLLEPAQFQELPALLARFPDPKALAGELIHRNWLTPYQANQLLQGHGQELLLGSYVFLERLGEGGMGQVFKARNWKLGRIVAVKLIRKERLTNADAIRRFQREVRAAAALSHPNIVHAYDADEIGGTQLLVMECVEGATDLARLVKKNGPLPAAQACEIIRQAALGLQHAYERGLVHRDIKPHNLLLTANGQTVKILDMGLARLDHREGDDDKSSTMTQEGTIMGTPDYIAPEQARQSHLVDIRADLYSLGCTLYYLLTGQVPFPGGSLMEKLLHHRLDEPKPVEQFRPALPAAVAAIVRKLMAKRPEDRYQTPAEVVAALTAVAGAGASLPATHLDERTLAEPQLATVGTGPSSDTLASPFADLGEKSDALPAPTRSRPADGRLYWLAFGMAGGGVVLIVLIGILVLLILHFKKPASNSPAQPEAESVVANSSSKTSKKVDDDWLTMVAALPAEKQVDAVAAKLKELNKGFDGQVMYQIDHGVVTEFTLLTDRVTDLSPLRALRKLTTLNCSGGWYGGGSKLSDLTPLKDLKLTSLSCYNTQIHDLTPLRDMPLTSLDCRRTRVADLTPLRDMRLTTLNCSETHVSDLTPLHGMKLTSLDCHSTEVADLSPLRDMKLTYLHCYYTKVKDLTPLKNMNLTYLDCGATLVADLAPLQNMPLTYLHCSDTQIKTLAPLKDMPLTNLWCGNTEVADLTPLKGMPLTELRCNCRLLAELSPLKDMKLTSLYCNDSQVADLSPLHGMKLTYLSCENTKVRDLSVLKNMPLTSLYCSNTPVADLSPLKDMKLTALSCVATQVTDLTPLSGMPLTEFQCQIKLPRDAALLRSLTALKTLNNIPVKDLVTTLNAKPLPPLDDAWFKQVAEMPADKQVKAVAAKLAERNPGFNGKVTPDIEGANVIGLEVSTDHVTDLSPIRALKELKSLNCSGTWDAGQGQGQGQLYDLSPLEGMKLTSLNVNYTRVLDLSPLKDMPLTRLECYRTMVSDLSPLQGMPLKSLTCGATVVFDLTPLQGMKLTYLECSNSRVADLTPLKDAKLTYLVCGGSRISDLGPLKDMKLTRLDCYSTAITDLTPLKNMPLYQLHCGATRVSDLTPLRDMQLSYLYCNDTLVADLTPLKDMKLSKLSCANTKVSDLSPLKNMPLKEIGCDFKPERDAELLRSLKTLETINGKPVAQFWKEVEAMKR